KFYHAPGPKRDMIILVGDVQAVSSEAQYEVTGKILDYYHSLGGSEIITLGGYGTGKAITAPRVLGAASHKKLVPGYAKQGIVFGESRGAIVGAAGLLLGLGRIRGMHGVCLMGETHGGFVDPRSAQAVLEMLGKMMGVKIDISGLQAKIEQGDKFVKKMEAKAAKTAGQELVPGGAGARPHDLSYIR
ncbi:MAG: PAC2 family protein, partial [Candidatus Micrarchaeota archaeon]|nr:PAC2 family protein [Candidatus Micrarchaeota archaeon]